MKGNSILEIARALRCTSTVHDLERDCAACRYWQKETVLPEYREKLGVDEMSSCDIDQIGLDAAEMLETLEAKLPDAEAENEKLRRELSELERKLALRERLQAAANEK